jgi:hypothetical protein
VEDGSFTSVRSEFRIALLLFQISSMNANSAWGSLPVTTRAKRSCSRALSLHRLERRHAATTGERAQPGEPS